MKRSWHLRPRTVEGGPCWGRMGCTALHGVRLSSAPSGDRSANPARAPGCSGLPRLLLSVLSARNRSGAESLATPSGISRAATSVVSCRPSGSGRRSSCSKHTRDQSRETGSLSRLFSSVETTAKCISLGPADCRERLSYSVRHSAATFQRVISHVCESRAGSGIRTGGELSLEEGGYRGGPSSWQRVRVLQPVLRCSKERWGLRPILDLRLLNRSVRRLKFRMLTVKQVVSQLRSEDWFVTIDLKYAYVHISILPSHRKFLRFAFRGKAYQYRVLPFGLTLSPRTFTKCVDAALAPLRLQGIRILNYIDDWLILAHSEQMAVRHRDVVLAQMKELRLRLNAKKSVLSPLQRTTYLGVVWDSTTMQARLSPARIESILSTVRRVSEGLSLTVKQFQRLLGLMAAASNVIPFGLLYMRPLQWWLKSKGFSPRRCLRALDMWRKPWFLSQGPVLGAPCRRVMLAADASLTGWGAVMSGHPARGLWSGHHLTWHINCLEMLPVFRALKHFLPDLRNHNVLVRTDNTAVVSYINHQGGLHSRPLYKLAHQILVWYQDKFLSLRAVYISGHLNVGADILSRQGPRPGEWRLHPEVVKQIWRVFGQAQVDLFATCQTSHCPLWYSLTHPAPLGLDAMVQTWPRLRLYAFPLIVLLPGVLEIVRRDGVWLLIVAPFWPGRVWFSDLVSLLDGSPWEIPGKDPLITRFLRSVMRLRPRVRSRVPPWDLAVVLEALCKPPFEPIEEVSERLLTLKTVLLLAISSLKRVGDLQALSVAPSFLDFAPGLAKAFMYLPKVPSSVPRPVVLQAFCPPPLREPDQEKLNCMCPVQALYAYVHRTALWRKTDQLLVCYGPPKKGLSASKQTLSRWIVDAIIVAYKSSDLPSPLGVKAHSTRGMAASKAFLAGVPIQDICDAAGWSTPLTFSQIL